ncbi:MAG: rhodanese-like domain-containing protein [Deltaproteobacteria bacterium]|nr:rhodanese-like domain-containing protein [Deltaproteobacteria bacterium]MBT4269059.1 rhodanese-like domain-containing protein [Deltaproteobacteria bacterium]MBT4638101.1 rhodanese-like domain-containing protein [Deltaproteobacteria bacterium]MBT6500011.1 rhodanese-like domain-containing protein [Deltaproteobacteria bacterium]MBT6611496.1 rhodanese-like domain-containing protein [Deltaproteobacteria bacterium]
MINRIRLLVMTLFISSVFFTASPAIAKGKKARILKPCKQCHELESSQFRGRMQARSNKAKTLRIFTGNGTWLVNFDKSTEVDGAKSIGKIKKNIEVLVDYEKKGNTLFAKSVTVKPAADIPAKWVLDVKKMKKLMAKSPVKGNYALYDARPGKLFPANHLKGAISNYDGKFAKNIGKLPKDKNKLLVFYCGGPT